MDQINWIAPIFFHIKIHYFFWSGGHYAFIKLFVLLLYTFFFLDKIISSVSLSRISQLETKLDEKWFKLPVLPCGDKKNTNALETEKDE